MELYASYSGIRRLINEQFSTLLDYVWKTPLLIEGLLDVEKDKLEAYFPLEKALDDPLVAQLRVMRFQHEQENLYKNFPLYQARSNLFLAASMFEHYLFDIAIEVQEFGQLKLANFSGNGYAKIVKFLKVSGIEVHKLPLYEQIDALVTIRNCLIHADGRVELSRDRNKILSIIKRSLHIQTSRRNMNENIDDRGWKEIELVKEFGQIRVNNNLSLRSCSYFRDFLLGLAKAALKIDEDSPL